MGKRMQWSALRLLPIALLSLTLLLASFIVGCAQIGGKNTSGSGLAEPVTLIIAFPAGGSSDIQAKIVEKYWSKYFNRPMAIEYKTGAGGQVGFTAIAQGRPDGSVIGGVNVPHILLQSLGAKATFKKDDFIHIAQVVNDPQLLIVSKTSPIRSLNELIDEAKRKKGQMTVGVVGFLSGHHLALLKMQDLVGLSFTAVPFEGAADQTKALAEGKVDAIIGNLNDVMRGMEKFRMLAIASEKRHSVIRNVPTFKELGYDFTSDIRRGFSVPAGTDPETVARLREGFRKICQDAGYQEDMEKIGQPAEYLSGEDFTAYCDRYFVEAKGLIEKYGLNNTP
ncbi:tripartite tricarboxylate transporter substrate binding protein [Heliobacterium gestii]|uniref:Tripartite tricarboxylate transporter substrate binding protein n=1 Tax=Heliomicrobium gestii TaxID=2699 RepID=A0A845LAR3_HELGE|nr:tripartite tricarboxylate transporter substrate binding protein [Heliomicrobium gestii]MBM7865774.1 tripartite-type tricarboxylate transporter receptor subunit TctC [Heliomicrobium gestii]MZP42020.1 tripartite tricarboxylate transporter substrate binding protein [Heliomicrobium gestii]